MDAFVTALAKVDRWGVKRARGQVREWAPTVLVYYVYVVFIHDVVLAHTPVVASQRFVSKSQQMGFHAVLSF